MKGDDGQRLAFPTDGAGQFVKPPGALATLESVASGYRLTTSEQLVYEFDSAGKLWFTQRGGKLSQVGGPSRTIPDVVEQGESGLMGLELDDRGEEVVHESL